MKKIFFSMLVCLQGLISFSQNFEWARSIGGAGTFDLGNSMSLDKAGNIYTSGSFQGIADFDPGAGIFNMTASGSSDIFISKLNSSGNFLWAKQIAGVPATRNFPYSLVLDSLGNIYITGIFKGTVDFDPGTGVHNLTSVSYPFASSVNVFVLKLDSDGNFLWAKNMGGSSGESEGRSLDVDKSGNVFIAGFFSGIIDFNPGSGTYQLTSNSNDGFIVKLDVNGNFLWALQLGGSTGSEIISSIKLDNNGNLYATGSFTETTDFDLGSGLYELTSVGGPDIFVFKMDNEGNFLWAKALGSTDTDWGQTIQADSLGNVYVAGYFSGSIDFDPGLGNNNINSAGLWDAFVLKLDHDGNFLWAKSFGSANNDDVTQIILDADRNVYLVGKFWDTIDAEPGPDVYNISSLGVLDVFIIKLNEDGNFVWAIREGASDNDLSASVAVDSLQNVYVMGNYTLTVDFDPGTDVYNLSSTGGYDIFILKLRPGILPVNFLDFNVVKNKADAYLTWVTSTESNTDKFEIERSTDGISFKNIGEVNASVNSNTIKTYYFSDHNAGINFPGKNLYYRFKQLDLDGHYTFSPVRSVKFEENQYINVYPNPATDIVTIEASNSYIGSTYRITNEKGQNVLMGRINKVISKIKIKKLPAGIYFLQVEKNKHVIKIIKL